MRVMAGQLQFFDAEDFWNSFKSAVFCRILEIIILFLKYVLYTRISEVNLSPFIYRLLHEIVCNSV